MKPHPTRRASPDIATAPLSSTHQVTARHTLPQVFPRPPTLNVQHPQPDRNNSPTSPLSTAACKPFTTPPPPVPRPHPSSQPHNCPTTSLTVSSSRSAPSRTQSQLGTRLLPPHLLQRPTSRAATCGLPISYVAMCGLSMPYPYVSTCEVPISCVPA